MKSVLVRVTVLVLLGVGILATRPPAPSKNGLPYNGYGKLPDAAAMSFGVTTYGLAGSLNGAMINR